MKLQSLQDRRILLSRMAFAMFCCYVLLPLVWLQLPSIVFTYIHLEERNIVQYELIFEQEGYPLESPFKEPLSWDELCSNLKSHDEVSIHYCSRLWVIEIKLSWMVYHLTSVCLSYSFPARCGWNLPLRKLHLASCLVFQAMPVM